MNKKLLLLIFSFAFLVGIAIGDDTFPQFPPSLNQIVQPNILVVCDNSGSMSFWSNEAWVKRPNAVYRWYNWDDPIIDQGPDDMGYKDGRWIQIADHIDDIDTFDKLQANNLGHLFDDYVAAGESAWLSRVNSVKNYGVAIISGKGNDIFTGQFAHDNAHFWEYNSYGNEDHEDLGNRRYLTNYDGLGHNGYVWTVPRMTILKYAATKVILNNPSMRFGIGEFYRRWGGTGNGGKIRKVITDLKDNPTETDEILYSIYTLLPRGNTPVGEAMVEMGKYYSGDSDEVYHWSTDSFGTAPCPVTDWCQHNFIILITDGEPTSDNTASEFYPYLYDGSSWKYGGCGNADGDAHCDNSSSSSDLVDDVAFYLRNEYDASDLDTTQYLRTYVIDVGAKKQVLKDTAQNGEGQYYYADNVEGLITSLNAVINEIASIVYSSTAIGVVSGKATTDTMIYRATFNQQNWQGDVTAFIMNPDGTLQNFPDNPQWSANEVLDSMGASGRNIFSTVANDNYSHLDFVEGEQANFTEIIQDTTDITDFVQERKDLINYVRGDQSEDGIKFRNRDTMLADIINSSPVAITEPHQAYTLLNYKDFVTAHAGRERMLFFGANDGMLHCLDANTGQENWAFIPREVIPNLQEFASPEYGHKYFVDLIPTIQDIYDASGNWKTVLAGGLRGGGKAIFAIDVTNPNSPSVLWYHDSTTLLNGTDKILGYSTSEMTLARVKDDSYPVDGSYPGRYCAIFSSGWDSEDAGKGHFIALDANTGNLIRDIKVDETINNHMASPSVGDTSGNGIANFAAVGDINGRMWYIDMDTENPASWTCELLFRAVHGNPSSEVVQPITCAPGLSKDLNGNIFVTFGTGIYYKPSHRSITDVQSIYTLRFNEDTTLPLADERETSGDYDTSIFIKKQISLDGDYVNVDNNDVLQDNHVGWYMDSIVSGERFIYTPLVFSGTSVYSSLVPSEDDACEAGGYGYLYQFALTSGNSSETGDVGVVAEKFSGGNPNAPVLIPDPGTGSPLVGVGTLNADIVTRELNTYFNMFQPQYWTEVF